MPFNEARAIHLVNSICTIFSLRKQGTCADPVYKTNETQVAKKLIQLAYTVLLNKRGL